MCDCGGRKPTIQDVTLDDDISGLQPGSVIPALYNGGDVFAAYGSTGWLYNLLVLTEPRPGTHSQGFRAYQEDGGRLRRLR